MTWEQMNRELVARLWADAIEDMKREALLPIMPVSLPAREWTPSGPLFGREQDADTPTVVESQS